MFKQYPYAVQKEIKKKIFTPLIWVIPCKILKKMEKVRVANLFLCVRNFKILNF